MFNSAVFLWRCTRSFASQALVVISFLVGLLHDIVQYYYHTTGFAVSNKQILNDSIFDAFFATSAVCDTNYLVPLGRERTKRLHAPPKTRNNALRRLPVGSKLADVTKQHAAAALVHDHNRELDAVFSIITEATGQFETAANLPGTDSSKRQSIAGDGKLGQNKPTVRSKPRINEILKELDDKLGQSSSTGTPTEPLTFKYIIHCDDGFVLVGISKSGFSFWVHAPSVHTPPGPDASAHDDSTHFNSTQGPTAHAPTTPLPSGSGNGNGRGRGKGSRGGKQSGGGISRPRGGGGNRARNNGNNGNNGNNENNGNNGNNESNDNNDGIGDGNNDDVYFACPFYKFDPITHFRCYCKYELRRYSDVKQHILRCHALLQLYCTNCWRTWRPEKSAEWEAHSSQLPQPCQHVPQPEHLIAREQSDLNDLALGRITDAEKWYRMWDLLFVNHPRPNSPHVKRDASDIICMLASGHEELLRQLPGILEQINAPVNHPQTLEDIGQRFHSIYTSTLSAGQPRERKYRRQHAIQQQLLPPAPPPAPAPHHFPPPLPLPPPAPPPQLFIPLPVFPTPSDIMEEDELNQYLDDAAFEFDQMLGMPPDFGAGPPQPPQPPAPHGY